MEPFESENSALLAESWDARLRRMQYSPVSVAAGMDLSQSLEDPSRPTRVSISVLKDGSDTLTLSVSLGIRAAERLLRSLEREIAAAKERGRR